MLFRIPKIKKFLKIFESYSLFLKAQNYEPLDVQLYFLHPSRSFSHNSGYWYNLLVLRF